jgi:hypothetical protein
MKILMTGYTPRGVGSTRLLYSYMSNTSVIIKALQAAGHTVDHRIVDVDDETIAQQYDVAFIGLALPASLSSRFGFGALWTLEKFGLARTRFFVDDWLLHQLQSQYQSILRDPGKRLFSLPQRHCYEAAKLHQELWVKWYKFLSRDKYKLLIPAFPWAKPRILLPDLPNIEPVIFDPTPLALLDPEVFCGTREWPQIPALPMMAREKKWVLAAMRDVKPWMVKQRFEWPVLKYGNKREGEEVLEEKALIQSVYPTNVGIIGAPYPKVTAGGGWRARYVHAAMTRSVLFLDPDEGRTAGQPYNLFRTVVEKASNDQLTEIAELQRSWLLAKTWTSEQLYASVDDYAQGVTRG